MIFTVKARVGSHEMDRLSGACQRGEIGWHEAVQWIDRQAQQAAQRAVQTGIERLALATPEEVRIIIATAALTPSRK